MTARPVGPKSARRSPSIDEAEPIADDVHCSRGISRSSNGQSPVRAEETCSRWKNAAQVYTSGLRFFFCVYFEPGLFAPFDFDEPECVPGPLE